MAQNNPFNFTFASCVEDILNQETLDIFDMLAWQGMRADKAFDLFYDALEWADESLKRQVADACEKLAVRKAEEIGGSVSRLGVEPEQLVLSLQLTRPSSLLWMLADTQRTAQQAIRITQIKGEDTNPLLREIAREVSALPEAERESPMTMISTIVGAYRHVLINPSAPSFDQPPPPKPETVQRNKPKHGGFTL